MSTLRLTTLIAAITTTLLLVLAYTLEGVAHKDLVPAPIGLLTSIASGVAWTGFVVAHCRDTITATIAAAVAEAGGRRATEARIDTIAKLGKTQAPDPGRPNAHRLGLVDN